MELFICKIVTLFQISLNVIGAGWPNGPTSLYRSYDIAGAPTLQAILTLQ